MTAARGTGQRRATTTKRAQGSSRPAATAVRTSNAPASTADEVLAEARATALEIVGIARDLAREAQMTPAPPPPTSVASLAPIAAELERLSATLDDWTIRVDALRAEVAAAARSVLDEQSAAVLATALAALPSSSAETEIAVDGNVEPADPVPAAVETAETADAVPAAVDVVAPRQHDVAARRRFGRRREATGVTPPTPVATSAADAWVVDRDPAGPALKPGLFGR